MYPLIKDEQKVFLFKTQNKLELIFVYINIMKNNFITKKPSENSKLLSILTNRQRAKSVSNLRNNQWPGKLNPNFTETIRIQTASISRYNNKTLRFKSLSNLKTKYVTQIPTVQMMINGQLQLLPSNYNKISRQPNFNTTFYITHRHKSSTKSDKPSNGIIKIQQNQSHIQMSNIFKNLQISKQVNDVISKKILKQNQNQAQSKNLIDMGKLSKIFYQHNNDNNQQLFTNQKMHVKTARQNNKNGNKNQSFKNKYKVDFLAFGFIQKVIDNPQVWGKYVHKIQDKRTSISELQKN